MFINPQPRIEGCKADRRRSSRLFAVEMLEDRTLLSTSTIGNISIDDTPHNFPLSVDNTGIQSGALEVSGVIADGAGIRFRIDPTIAGRLTVQASVPGVSIRLSLLDRSSNILVQSDGQSPSDTRKPIDLHVQPGTYEIELDSRSGSGPYQIRATLTPSTDPGQSLPGSQIGTVSPLVVGDLNGDVNPDVITPAGVLLGIGDGTFQRVLPAQAFATPAEDPSAMVLADFYGDGFPDLAVADSGTNSVSVFRGLGGGKFAPPVIYPVGTKPVALAVGHFGGNGSLDLAVADSGSNDVTILKDDGKGHFLSSAKIPVGNDPRSLAVADLNNDNHDDLVVACRGKDKDPGEITLLLGVGGGQFQPTQHLKVGVQPVSVAVEDFNGDGFKDLAVSLQGNTTALGEFDNFNGISALSKVITFAKNASKNTGADTGGLAILLNRGDGSFRSPMITGAGLLPSDLLVGDFNQDGRPDVALLHGFSTEVTVFLNDAKNDGWFEPPIQVNSPPSALGTGGIFHASAALGDFNGDRLPDLLISNALTLDVSVLIARGDGSFMGGASNATGDGPFAVAVGDLTGNGHKDLVVANILSNTVTVLLGRGDGTFDPPVQYPTGLLPSSVAIGDFNGDGRQDLAVTNFVSNTVSILLGNGDGTFQARKDYPVGNFPISAVAGDLNGDGTIDLAVAGASGAVATLMGRGDGTFEPGMTYSPDPIGFFTPVSITTVLSPVTRRLDLAVADLSGSVMILKNKGDGQFALGQAIPIPGEASSIVVGDFNGDGILDIAVADAVMEKNTGMLSVLLGRGDGSFNLPINSPLPPGSNPISINQASFDRERIPDLVVGEDGTFNIDFLSPNGDGTFRLRKSIPAKSFPLSIAIGDFEGNGRPGIVYPRIGLNDVVVLTNLNGSLVDPSTYATATESTPLVADLDGDGILDTIVVDTKGQILWRRGRPGGAFDPPITVNPDGSQFLSRNIDIVETPSGPMIASVDANRDDLTIFAFRDGRFQAIGTYPTGPTPAQVVAVALSGTARSALLVRNAGDGSITPIIPVGNGVFASQPEIPVGLGTSDLKMIDAGGPGIIDLVAVNQLTGNVQVLARMGGNSFTSIATYAASTSPAEASSDGSVTGQELPSGVASGPLTGGPGLDLVTISPNSSGFNILASLGDGRYANPIRVPTLDSPRLIRVANLRQDGIDDVITLGSDGIRVYLGDGHGQFRPGQLIPAGVDPTGLSVAFLGNSPFPSLLVGNPYGDVLVLVGLGDGTFQTPTTPNPEVGLAVIVPGQNVLVATNQSSNQVAVQAVGSPPQVIDDQSSGLIAPGKPIVVVLGADGIPDLMYANSGGNSIEIRPYLGPSKFGPTETFPVGTNPSGIAVHYDQGRPDLLAVADTGSNDVQIIFVKQVDGHRTLQAGPRLLVGNGPTSVQFVDAPGGRFPSLLVADSLSNDVRVLKGVGQGFFDDQNARVIPVGSDPNTVLVGNFTGNPTRLDAVTINVGSGNLTMIPDILGAGQPLPPISSGGTNPIAAIEVTQGGQGPTDLIVANFADGKLALFLGGSRGLELSDTMSLAQPTGLAFDPSLNKGDLLEFYSANAGSAGATLLSFNLAKSGPVSPLIGDSGNLPLLGPEGTGSGGGSGAALSSLGPREGGESNITSIALGQPVARFQSVSNTPFVVIATLLTVTEGANTIETTSINETASAGALPNQPAPRVAGATGRNGEDVAAEPEGGLQSAAVVPEATSPLDQFLFGIDEAFQQFRSDSRKEALKDRSANLPLPTTPSNSNAPPLEEGNEFSPPSDTSGSLDHPPATGDLSGSLGVASIIIAALASPPMVPNRSRHPSTALEGDD